VGEGGSPYLDFGDRDNRMTPGDLASHESDELPYWRRNAPLVFINGCETSAARIDSWLGFVRTFGSMNASGVIGTEIPVRSDVAAETANEFWTRLESRHTVGESLHAARLRLLRKGDLVGLGYTAYCSAHLRLSPTAGTSGTEGVR
jgi:CHAT domain-containing protein